MWPTAHVWGWDRKGVNGGRTRNAGIVIYPVIRGGTNRREQCSKVFLGIRETNERAYAPNDDNTTWDLPKATHSAHLPATVNVCFVSIVSLDQLPLYKMTRFFFGHEVP